MTKEYFAKHKQLCLPTHAIYLLLFILITTVSGTAQALIKGQVKDSNTQEPLVAYTLVIYDSKGNYKVGTMGDANGNFEIPYPKLLSFSMEISHLGYETKLIKINKESLAPFYEIQLSSGRNILDGLEIVAAPYHYFDVSKIGELTIDKYHPGIAASFDDPSRSVLRIPGTGTQNDQANTISYHGLPNEMINWKIDGAEVLNPNHLNSAGTISNRSTSNAGGVLAIPFEVLDSYSFYPAPFSKTHGNAIGGISNIRPRKTIPDRNGFAKIGILGAEAGFSKAFTPITGMQAHYRYSFTGILGDLGVDFDGEKIRYQDLFMRFHFLDKPDRAINFSFIGGHNKNEKRGPLFQNTEGYLGTAGLTMFRNFNNTSEIHTSIFFSRKRDDGFNSDQRARPNRTPFTSLLQDRQDKTALFSEFRHRASKNATHSIGLNVNFWAFNYVYSEKGILEDENLQTFYSSIDRDVLYGNVSYGLEIDAHSWVIKPAFALAFTPQKNIYLEPGISLSKISNRFKFALGSNFSNQNQEAAIYGLAEEELNRSSGGQPQLENSRAINSFASLTYQLSTDKKSTILLKLFNHNLFNLPIPDDAEKYFPYSGTDFIRPTKLRNEGLAYSRGIEASFDHAFSDDFHFVLNGSVFTSVYQRDGENVNFPAPNNFGFTSNVFGTKEFRFGTGKLFVSLAGHFRGGAYMPRVDTEQSELSGRIVYSSTFEQMGNYLRFDTRLNYTFGKNQIILDIQNLSNTLNEAYFSYDLERDEEFIEKQLGLIPVFSYRREF